MDLGSMLPKFGGKKTLEAAPCSVSAEQPARPVVPVALKNINKSGHNMRPLIGDEDGGIWTLAESIQKDGLLNPVIVCRAEPGQPGQYGLVAGYRRLRACELLKHETIPAFVYEPEEVATFFYIENEHREALPPIVRSWSTAKMLAVMGLTQEQLAGRLGREIRDVTDDLAISRLPTKLREALLEGQVVVARSILVEIAQCDDSVLQSEMVKLALAGASRAAIRRAGIARKARTKATAKRALAAAVSSARGIAEKLDRVEIASGNDDEKCRLADLKVVVANVAARIADIETKWANAHAGDASNQSAA